MKKKREIHTEIHPLKGIIHIYDVLAVCIEFLQPSLLHFIMGHPSSPSLSLSMDVIRGWSQKSDQGKIPHHQLPAQKSWRSPVIVDPLFDCMVFKGHIFFCYHRFYLTLLMLPRVSLTNHTLIT